MPMVTDHMDTQLMAMVSMERDLLMPSQRLMPTMDTLDMPDLMLMAMDTQLMAMVSMERDLLMPSQRLMPTMDTSDMPDLMLMAMDTLLMALMAMDTQLMAMVSMKRDLLMLSQRLMPTTADTMDMPDHTPMDMPDTDMVVISGDKLNSSQLRSSKANNKYQ